MIRVLIVDDEEHARVRVRRLVAANDDMLVVGECENGEEAIASIQALSPDLVILDVQMPVLSGLGVMRAVGPEKSPVVIFVTAFEEYAVRAFEACALDYVLKPFDNDRFQLALRRARRQLQSLSGGNNAEDFADRLHALTDNLDVDATARGYPDVIAVKSGRRYRVVRVAELDWIEADGNYSRLHMGKNSVVLHRAIGDLEKSLLDPAVFLRIHRSTIVNVARIAELEPTSGEEFEVRLVDGTVLSCSRSYRARLRERIHLTR